VARARAEAQAVRQALAVARGNLSRASELLGVTRPTLYDLLDKHGIDSAQFSRPAAALGAGATKGGAGAGPGADKPQPPLETD
jgi:Bacterial regulatory protein, Fis family